MQISGVLHRIEITSSAVEIQLINPDSILLNEHTRVIHQHGNQRFPSFRCCERRMWSWLVRVRVMKVRHQIWAASCMSVWISFGVVSVSSPFEFVHETPLPFRDGVLPSSIDLGVNNFIDEVIRSLLVGVCRRRRRFYLTWQWVIVVQV